MDVVVPDRYVANTGKLYSYLIALTRESEYIHSGIDLLRTYLDRVDISKKDEKYRADKKKDDDDFARQQVQRGYLNLALTVASVLEIPFEEIECRFPTKVVVLKESMVRVVLTEIPPPISNIEEFDIFCRLNCYVLYNLGQAQNAVSFGSDTKAVAEKLLNYLQSLLVDQDSITLQAPGYLIKYVVCMELGYWFCFKLQFFEARSYFLRAQQLSSSLNLMNKTYRARLHVSRLDSLLALTSTMTHQSLVPFEAMPSSDSVSIPRAQTSVINRIFELLSFLACHLHVHLNHDSSIQPPQSSTAFANDSYVEELTVLLLTDTLDCDLGYPSKIGSAFRDVLSNLWRSTCQGEQSGLTENNGQKTGDSKNDEVHRSVLLKIVVCQIAHRVIQLHPPTCRDLTAYLNEPDFKSEYAEVSRRLARYQRHLSGRNVLTTLDFRLSYLRAGDSYAMAVSSRLFLFGTTLEEASHTLGSTTVPDLTCLPSNSKDEVVLDSPVALLAALADLSRYEISSDSFGKNLVKSTASMLVGLSQDTALEPPTESTKAKKRSRVRDSFEHQSLPANLPTVFHDAGVNIEPRLKRICGEFVLGHFQSKETFDDDYGNFMMTECGLVKSRKVVAAAVSAASNVFDPVSGLSGAPNRLEFCANSEILRRGIVLALGLPDPTSNLHLNKTLQAFFATYRTALPCAEFLEMSRLFAAAGPRGWPRLWELSYKTKLACDEDLSSPIYMFASFTLHLARLLLTIQSFYLPEWHPPQLADGLLSETMGSDLKNSGIAKISSEFETFLLLYFQFQSSASPKNNYFPSEVLRNLLEHKQVALVLAPLLAGIIHSVHTFLELRSPWSPYTFDMVAPDSVSQLLTRAFAKYHLEIKAGLTNVEAGSFLGVIYNVVSLSQLLYMYTRLAQVCLDEAVLNPSFPCFSLTAVVFPSSLLVDRDHREPEETLPTTWALHLASLAQGLSNYTSELRWLITACSFALSSLGSGLLQAPAFLRPNSPYLQRLIATLVNVQAYAHAAVLCQFLIPAAGVTRIGEPSEYDSYLSQSSSSGDLTVPAMLERAFALLRQSPGTHDHALYAFLWHTPLLELLVFLHTKRSESAGRTTAFRVLSSPVLNTHTDPNLRKAHIAVLKRQFVARLVSDFLT